MEKPTALLGLGALNSISPAVALLVTLFDVVGITSCISIRLRIIVSLTPGMSCRQKRRALCSSLCKGRAAFACQLHPFVRRHRVPLPLRL